MATRLTPLQLQLFNSIPRDVCVCVPAHRHSHIELPGLLQTRLHASARLATLPRNWHGLHINSLEPGSFTFFFFFLFAICLTELVFSSWPGRVRTAAASRNHDAHTRFAWNTVQQRWRYCNKKCKHSMFLFFLLLLCFNKIALRIIYMISFCESHTNGLKS